MKNIIFLMFLIVMLSACMSNDPVPVLLHKDACASCMMSISEGNFAAEIITKKGRVYKFDDISCMKEYVSANEAAEIDKYYVGDYPKENELIDATKAWYVYSKQVKSPMGGHIAAFSDKATAEKLATELQTIIINWDEIKPATQSGNNGNERKH